MLDKDQIIPCFREISFTISEVDYTWQRSSHNKLMYWTCYCKRKIPFYPHKIKKKRIYQENKAAWYNMFHTTFAFQILTSNGHQIF
jgi:hypothetical protein